MTFDYPRTPTDAMIRVKFSNGEVYDVPAQVVADDRDAFYNSIGITKQSDTIRDMCVCIKRCLIAWATNEMNWSDLAPHARKVDVPPTPFDYEADWDRAEKAVVGEV